MKKYHKKLTMLLVLGTLCITLSGCGESKTSNELKEYRTQMETILGNISEINSNMNDIDESSEAAVEELLSYLDSLEGEFASMAELTAPSQFSSIDELADQAYDNMVTTNEMYHEAFSNSSYNEYVAEAALEYYERVNKRLQIIIQLLHGETPEGDGVTVTTDTTTTSPLKSYNDSKE